MGKKKTIRRKFIPKECSNNMTFDECELAILRQAVDTNEKIAGQKIASSDQIKHMIEIVEKVFMLWWYCHQQYFA